MTAERINPPGLARPSGFSHAVSATGRMVFLAGQLGLDRDAKLAEGGVVPQFEQALGNLLAALTAAGGQPSDLVSLTIYLTDLADFQTVNDAYGKRFSRSPQPARSTVQVAALPRGARVEVDAIAVVPQLPG